MQKTLYTSKITGNILKKINQEIENKGIPEGVKSIFKRLHTEIVVNKQTEEIDKVLSNDPVILICNHPSEAEVLIMLTLIKNREDVYLIMNHNFTGILPSIDKKIIPVYVSQRLISDKFNYKFRILRKIHRSDNFSKEESHIRNIASILEASKRVSQGQVIIIFPAAGEKNNHFLPGIGHLIKNLTNKDKAKLVMAYVRGTSTFDYLRFIPLLNRLMPKIRIDLAKPLEISKYKSDDAKKIAKMVEKDFYEWSNKL